MGTALLGWELGGGLGHVGKLLEVARGLADLGHTPVLALKDLAVARPLLRGVPYRVIQAPVWPLASAANFQASSYADILAERGYAEPEGLGLLVGAWQSLIDLTGAGVVVCDHAPTLCLAAYGRTPSVVIGIGFAVPPTQGAEFPPLAPGSGPPASTGRLLEVVRSVQTRRGLPAPETLPGLLARSARFVHTFAEIDAYRSARRDEVVEPMHAPPPPAPEAPRDDFFAYLSGDFPGVGLILPHLAAAGFRGSAYLRGSPPDLVESARRAGVEVYDEPPPLGRVLAGAAAVVHHGGLNTAEAALAAGRPQVLLPAHLEQTLTARALDGLGVARALVGYHPIQAASEALSLVTGPGGHDRRAVEVARAIEARRHAGCLPRILEHCHDRLS